MRFEISENPVDEELLSKTNGEFVVPYFEDYDDKRMWMSYWYQINEVLKTGGKRILVVGVGNKTVPNYLKTISEFLENKKLEITTADIDENLKPDHVCDVSELSEHFDSGFFDTILCAEVLEHISFKKFDKIMDELKIVTNEWVIISLPYAGLDFRLSLELPNRPRKEITLKIPDGEDHEYDGWHRWEVGKKNYSRKKISELISNYFEIVRSYFPPENMYHLFFVLRKK